ncbi:MAG: hypothetical protein ACRDSR_18130 [Pseudonocardiaceae bacterium]
MDTAIASWRSPEQSYCGAVVVEFPPEPGRRAPIAVLLDSNAIEKIAKRLPTLGIALGDHRPHVRGKIREYVSL